MLWWLYITIQTLSVNAYHVKLSVTKHRASTHPFPSSRWLCLFSVFSQSSAISNHLYAFISLSLRSCHVVEAAGNRNEMLKKIYISAELRAWQKNCRREVEEQQVFPFSYLSVGCHRGDQILSTRPSGNSLNGLVSWQESITLCLTTFLLGES